MNDAKLKNKIVISLLQASSPIQQLDLITDLLGTPTLSDLKYACDAAKRHMLSRGVKPPSIAALYTIGASATHEAVHLLCQMLTLDPDKRISVTEALNHPYLDEGRLRYHSCMCACCHSTPTGVRYTRRFSNQYFRGSIFIESGSGYRRPLNTDPSCLAVSKRIFLYV